ncbi:amidohydrolase [Daedaleopsis nitida]|nr:amidohydrolase [Daedaleopsis nitida]
MVGQPSFASLPTETRVQAGCWSSLLSLLRIRRSDQKGTVTSGLEAQLRRERDVVQPPAYVHFAQHWYDSYDDRTGLVRLSDKPPPTYAQKEEIPSEILQIIQDKLKKLSPELRKLSMDIWHHPEIMYEEKYAHDRLTQFMTTHGFTVTPHYLGMETAWKATFTHPGSGKTQRQARTIGVNSEMDALAGIGHACGHNLIAMSGAAVAIAIKAALQHHDVAGTIVLLGTPAEEAGGGKITLIERGAYKDMDACIMSHPSGGPENHTGISPGVACQHMEVEFFGHGAHAGAAPWEAQNALDAAFVAYASISALRQQMKPDHRVHGVISGRDWVPNIVPDYAKMHYIVRAPTWAELEALRDRVKACFEAAALATACKIEVALHTGYYNVRQNSVLAQEYARLVDDMYGMSTEIGDGPKYSTDFGNVTFEVPGLHPSYAIPTEPNGQNHTPQFTKAAATPEAHDATLKVAAAMAAIGFRVLQDAEFADEVSATSPDE